MVIKEGSGLADYIEYGLDRQSAFGVVDQNIVNKVSSKVLTADTESTAFNNAVNSTVGVIPIVGDTIDVINADTAMDYAGYVTGESMVAGNNVLAGTGVNWEEAKEYQRFIEDQALLESEGILDKSSVTAYIEKYREENPIDDSYEGILARYSGLEKEDVIALLDIIDYGNYLANYDPSDCYAFGQEMKVKAEELKFDNDEKVAYVVLLNTIEFADVRNRSFVV